FGKSMSTLAHEDVRWTFRAGMLAVQCDPGHNSRTHYQRLLFGFGDESPIEASPLVMNGTIVSLTEHESGVLWTATIRGDDGSNVKTEIRAPEMVHLMATADAASVYFTNARCRLDRDALVAVSPRLPQSPG